MAKPTWDDAFAEINSLLADNAKLAARVARLELELSEAERTIDRLRSELIVAESRQG